MRSRLPLAAVLGAAAVAAVLLVPRDPAVLRDAVAAAGAWAPLLLLAAWVAGTPLLVPGTLLCAAGGLLLGPLGIGVSLVGSPLGALAAFGLVRALGGRGVEDRLPARVRAAAARLEHGGVRARHFVVGSALGAAPRVVLYGVAGGAVLHASPVLVASAGAAALAAGGLLLARGLRRLPA
jgi:uncharacterized membrane protein YdjX (TVP38/TMEM64 family)